MTGGRAGRGGREGWKLWRVSFLPAKNNLYFLLYGLWFCSSGWVSDLTQWYQTGNRLLRASRMSKKVYVRHPNCTEARNKFYKLLKLRVVVLSWMMLCKAALEWSFRDCWCFSPIFHVLGSWYVCTCARIRRIGAFGSDPKCKMSH